MSSILDALNKLEQEKAQVEVPEEIERDIDPRQAARELIGGAPGQGRTLRLTPAAMLAGATMFMVAMIAISVGITVVILGGRTSTAPVQSAAAVPAIVTEREVENAAVVEQPAPVTPEPEPVAVAAVVPVEQKPEPVEVIVPVVEKVEVVQAPIAVVETAPAPIEAVAIAPMPVEPVEEMRSPEPVPVREPEAVVSRPAIAEPEPIVETPVVVARRDPVVEPKPVPITDMRKLPPLTIAVTQRYGADPILINMISPASANRPHAYAIINRIKVTVGDPIGNSRLRLVQVENHGIAVEAGGERFYVPF